LNEQTTAGNQLFNLLLVLSRVGFSHVGTLRHELVELLDELDGTDHAAVSLVELLKQTRIQIGHQIYEFALVRVEVFDAQIELLFERKQNLLQQPPKLLLLDFLVYGGHDGE